MEIDDEQAVRLRQLAELDELEAEDFAASALVDGGLCDSGVDESGQRHADPGQSLAPSVHVDSISFTVPRGRGRPRKHQPEQPPELLDVAVDAASRLRRGRADAAAKQRKAIEDKRAADV